MKTKFYSKSSTIESMRTLAIVMIVLGVASSLFMPHFFVFASFGVINLWVSFWMEKNPMIVFNDDHIFTKFAALASIRLIRYTDIESLAKLKKNKWSIIVKNGKPLTIHTKNFEPEDLDAIEALVNAKLTVN